MYSNKPIKTKRATYNNQFGSCRQNCMNENKNIIKLSDFKDENYGKRGVKKREELESGYKDFKIRAMLLQARLEKGMTQE